MKKILLLGGSEAQLISINKAKDLGYYTIVCDYLPDNPGQFIADAFYQVSTTDKEAILDIARKENIDGIVAYSSDPAAPTAAYVANKMNLPGMDYDVVRHFCEKQLFREFLKKNNFNVPNSRKIEIPYDESKIDLSEFSFPVIVKPTDSSGSKGITVLNDSSKITEALQYAANYSRNKTLIIEEFIVRDHPNVIEAEIFVINGEVTSWGLINSIRDTTSNPLLPAGYSYPLEITEERKRIVKTEISRLVTAAGNPSGAFNIEMIIDKNNRLFFLDAGPRNGGNRLPEFISMISGKDLITATILNAMGDMKDVDIDLDGESGGYWGLGVLHTNKSGKFGGVEYSATAKHALVEEGVQKCPGDAVEPFLRCNNLVGLTFYHFDTQGEMREVMYNMNNSMRVIVD